ncbi:BnaA08g03790D [Brassica napus]|uniref:(rape) hypothetical protein n=2 Tax=Brassica napus TaxID=3708 RepID=A0A078FRC9_BRANA|nr:unnamed protein product [Brassica napus]CDY17015.1 BnaA08g03790D [Brassica napus]
MCTDNGRDSKERTCDNWSHTFPSKPTRARIVSVLQKNGWSIFLAPFAAVGQITDFALVQQMCDTKHVLSDSDKSAITISTFD